MMAPPISNGTQTRTRHTDPPVQGQDTRCEIQRKTKQPKRLNGMPESKKPTGTSRRTTTPIPVLNAPSMPSYTHFPIKVCSTGSLEAPGINKKEKGVARHKAITQKEALASARNTRRLEACDEGKHAGTSTRTQLN
jgi:hypothetical protein